VGARCRAQRALRRADPLDRGLGETRDPIDSSQRARGLPLMTIGSRAAASLRSELLAHCYGCSGPGTRPRTRCRRPTCAAGGAGRASRGAPPCAPGCTGSPPMSASTPSATAAGERCRPGSAPTDDVDGPSEILPPETWVQPLADDRDDLRLALVAGMQALPATQRAVLLLRDALAFAAAEVADMLDTSTAAVKSSLQRARARMAEVAPDPHDVVEPRAPQARRLLDTYVMAFEAANVEALTAVVRADATLELVLGRAWYAGKATCSRVLASAVGGPGGGRRHRRVRADVCRHVLDAAGGPPRRGPQSRRSAGGASPIALAPCSTRSPTPSSTSSTRTRPSTSASGSSGWTSIPTPTSVPSAGSPSTCLASRRASSCSPRPRWA
jgi:RNA polymerase sigma-70 factor, ECF subfamily